MLMKLLRRWRGHPRRAKRDMPDPAPDAPVYVIGDIHGRVELLDRLIARIDTDAGGSAVIVLVGDYVDRGEDSAGVLARLRALEAERPDRIICLFGNHERMMLEFLDDPAGAGRRWLRNGGLQTLMSFDAAPAGMAVAESIGADDRARLAEALRAHLPDGLESWLRARPLTWQSGNVAVTHAGADPALTLDSQPETALIWGHRAFPDTPRADDLWIVHGHTIVDAPVLEPGRICVDTGAVFTGRLTAAALAPGAPVRFLTS